MRAPIAGPLVITNLFGSLRAGASEAYGVDHAGLYYHCIGHSGIDINCAIGTPVYAMKGGVLHFYGSLGGFADDGYAPLGLHAVVTLPTGEQHWYAHLSAAVAPDHAIVAEGQQIAVSGASGSVTGPHLHVGWRPAHFRYDQGFDGFDCWLTHLDPSALALVDLSLV